MLRKWKVRSFDFCTDLFHQNGVAIIIEFLISINVGLRTVSNHFHSLVSFALFHYGKWFICIIYRPSESNNIFSTLKRVSSEWKTNEMKEQKEKYNQMKISAKWRCRGAECQSREKWNENVIKKFVAIFLLLSAVQPIAQCVRGSKWKNVEIEHNSNFHWSFFFVRLLYFIIFGLFVLSQSQKNQTKVKVQSSVIGSLCKWPEIKKGRDWIKIKYGKSGFRDTHIRT